MGSKARTNPVVQLDVSCPFPDAADVGYARSYFLSIESLVYGGKILHMKEVVLEVSVLSFHCNFGKFNYAF